MLKNYKKKKEEKERTINLILIIVLVFITIGVGFGAYRFYFRIIGNSNYSIGSGNRYVNMIQNTIHREKVEEEEDTDLDLDSIHRQNENLIRSSIQSIVMQEDAEEMAFSKRFPVSNEEELDSNSFVIEPDTIPCVIFSALSNPVFIHSFFYIQSNAVGPKFPDIGMMSMTDLKVPGVKKLIYSKAVSVKNLVKGNTDVKRETHFR